MRFGVVAIVAGLTVSAGASADESKLANAIELNSIKSELERKYVAHRIAAVNIQSSDELREYWDRFYTQHAAEYRKALEIAERKVQDSTAFDALTWLVVGPLGYNDQTGASIDRALVLLAQHHLKNPRCATLCEAVSRFQIRSSGPDGFLRAMMGKTVTRNVRAIATLRLADMLFEHVRVAELLRNKDSKESEIWNSLLSVDRKRFFSSLDSPAAAREAEALLEKSAADYDDVKMVGGVSVGETARGRLFRRRAIVAGKPLPEYSSHSIEGEPMALADLRGKVVVVFFWASWCQPSLDVVPQIREMSQRLAKKPFAVLGIDGDHGLAAAQRAVEVNAINWKSIFDGNAGRGPLAISWGVNNWPYFIVVDSKGVIRQVQESGENLDALVDRLLSEVK